MSSYVLPPVKDGSIELAHFPTRMQAFIFRNWEFVSSEKLAEVLGTTAENVCSLAYGMGLAPQNDVSVWSKRGYITVIKQNWHILSYEQLLLLMDMDEERLAYILKEDDFLSCKLGDFKFGLYRLYDKMKAYGQPSVRNGIYMSSPRFVTRMIYSYHGLFCSDRLIIR